MTITINYLTDNLFDGADSETIATVDVEATLAKYEAAMIANLPGYDVVFERQYGATGQGGRVTVDTEDYDAEDKAKVDVDHAGEKAFNSDIWVFKA